MSEIQLDETFRELWELTAICRESNFPARISALEADRFRIEGNVARSITKYRFAAKLADACIEPGLAVHCSDRLRELSETCALK